MTGKEIRLNRLFASGGNAVVVAVDHGEFDGPLPGMIDLPEVVKKIDSSVDAILLAPGMLQHCGYAFASKGAPMAMMRLISHGAPAMWTGTMSLVSMRGDTMPLAFFRFIAFNRMVETAPAVRADAVSRLLHVPAAASS